MKQYMIVHGSCGVAQPPIHGTFWIFSMRRLRAGGSWFDLARKLFPGSKKLPEEDWNSFVVKATSTNWSKKSTTKAGKTSVVTLDFSNEDGSSDYDAVVTQAKSVTVYSAARPRS